MKINKNAGQALLVTLIALTCINMGGGSDALNTVKAPLFSQLERDETSFKASIYDDGKVTDVKDISFGGKITIGGIRREDDSAIIEVSLAKIKELTIRKKTYASERYGDKEFVLVDYVAPDGTEVTGLLFPHNLVVSGVSIKPSMNYAWKLRDLEKIVLHHPMPMG